MKNVRFLTIIFAIVFIITSGQAMIAPVHPASSAQNASSSMSDQANQPSAFYGTAVSNNSIANSSYAEGSYSFNGYSVPSKYVFMPDMHPALQNLSGSYVPAYSTSPAPMGIASYGVYNDSSGNIVSYTYTTTSFEGTVSVDNMTPFYLLNDAPQSIGIQLNSILTNVTVGSVGNYQYWNQNVMVYSARTNQIEFVDNIWNFSSPNAGMTNSTLYSHGSNGTLVPGSLYYGVSRIMNVSGPFAVSLYLNSTLQDGRNTVFFNYSISSGGKSYSGSYDNATFNSSSPLSRPASYYVSGNQLTPLGHIPYDAEFVMGGPGGGSTTSLLGINATMSLKYLNSATGSYSNVRSAYDAGSATGETANGIAASWNSQDQAVLTAGPSLVYGMWGISGSKMQQYSGSIDPSESFLFITPGTEFNNSTASWAPLSPDGQYNFTLPSGTYTAGLFSNWNDPFYGPFSSISGKTFSLVPNASMGIYTPLYIFGNKQLSQLSSGGSGSAGSPYIVKGTQNSSIYPVFGKFNDYAFPVFSGLLVSGTTDYAYFTGLPSFYIYYASETQQLLDFFGLPPVNYMNMEFYNDSHIAFVNNTFISGWFPYTMAGFYPAANVVFWNTTDSLIASNYFSSMDSSLLIYNYNSSTSGNTVWGNSFVQDALSESSLFSSINLFGAPTGLSMFSSGNLVYNNVFNVYFTAVSPGFDIYTGHGVNYTDSWNISREPLSYSTAVMGYKLSGGIMASGPDGIEYQGGNFWWNYVGNGSGVYNDSGLILNGGDMQPLTYHVFRVTFAESGLPAGTPWYVIIGTTSQIAVEGKGTSISFYEPNGTYYVQIYAGGYLANQSSGYLIVSGQQQSFSLIFRQLFILKFVESGLPAGSVWSIAVNGVTGSSDTNTIEYYATSGSYQYTPGNESGYYPEAATGTFVIYSSNTTIGITYLPYSFAVSFTESGLQAGTEWGIFVNGQNYQSRSSIVSLNLPNGTFDYSVTGAAGYYTESSYGTIQVNNGSASVAIAFSPENFTLTFTQKGLSPGNSWSVTIGGHRYTTTNTSLSIRESTGLLNYTIQAPAGYQSHPGSGSVDVNSNVSVPLQFGKIGAPTALQIVSYTLIAASLLILAYSFYLVRRKR